MAATVLKCVDCGMEFETETPQHEIVNAVSVSMVVFSHPMIPCCPKCGTAYRFEVAGLKQAIFGFKKVGLPGQIEVPSISLDLSMLKKKGD